MYSSDLQNSFDIELFQREHLELGKAIRETRRTLGADPFLSEDAVAALEVFFAIVPTHFEHEEEGGYMREAILRTPRIMDRAVELCEEHEMLLKEMQVIQSLMDVPTPEMIPWEIVTEKFSEFVQRLIRHETAENALLQKAYIEDIGGGE